MGRHRRSRKNVVGKVRQQYSKTKGKVGKQKVAKKVKKAMKWLEW